ncbi:MSMEG_6728 family protein [Blastococcus sp. TML/M2B]|uniref:MSMEG_6728 family protein n=2 Tax=unclassified Blastococcus TaxID=2619396 RepID=UPI001F5B3088|nr:MSMEG_6728 family protein [Blastococcus sp. TML/M2B]
MTGRLTGLGSGQEALLMQTFVPVADFTESARLLDNPRLGKQRVECLQVLRALELPDYGWANHPVVTMWRGHTAGLVVYSLAMVRVWRERGFADTTEALISEFAPDAAAMTQAEAQAAGLLPSWVGDEELHLSHRSNLLAKDPEFYRPRFPGDPDDLPYVWPGADEVPPAPAPEGVRVWVVRPRAHNELGACLAAGVIGLGTQSGIDVDATGLGPAELRDLSKEISGRRPAKDLRQLSTFLDELRPGDPVGLPIEHGAGLLLGEVVGDYLFQGRELLPHRRAARWDRVVPRSAARPPATLQDPRALFSVVLDPAALA